MKRFTALLLLVSLVSVSCTKFQELTAGRKKSVKVDFTFVEGNNLALTFTGEHGQGTYVFATANGLVQTKKLPADGTYTISLTGYSYGGCPVRVRTFENLPLIYTGGDTVTTSVSGKTLYREYKFDEACE